MIIIIRFLHIFFQTHLLLFNEETLQPHLNADQPIKTDMDRMNIVKTNFIFVNFFLSIIGL